MSPMNRIFMAGVVQVYRGRLARPAGAPLPALAEDGQLVADADLPVRLRRLDPCVDREPVAPGIQGKAGPLPPAALAQCAEPRGRERRHGLIAAGIQGRHDAAPARVHAKEPDVTDTEPLRAGGRAEQRVLFERLKPGDLQIWRGSGAAPPRQAIQATPPPQRSRPIR